MRGKRQKKQVCRVVCVGACKRKATSSQQKQGGDLGRVRRNTLYSTQTPPTAHHIQEQIAKDDTVHCEKAQLLLGHAFQMHRMSHFIIKLHFGKHSIWVQSNIRTCTCVLVILVFYSNWVTSPVLQLCQAHSSLLIFFPQVNTLHTVSLGLKDYFRMFTAIPYTISYICHPY